MYRYTTPTITCKLSGVDFANVDYVRIAVEGRNTAIVREIPAEEFTDGKTDIKLTQEETADLGPGDDTIKIQGRIKYADGTVQATSMANATLHDVLDKVVI